MIIQNNTTNQVDGKSLCKAYNDRINVNGFNQRNLHVIAGEIYKINTGIVSTLVRLIF